MALRSLRGAIGSPGARGTELWLLHAYVVCSMSFSGSGWVHYYLHAHTSHTHLLSYTLHHLFVLDVPGNMSIDGKYCTNIEYLRVSTSVMSNLSRDPDGSLHHGFVVPTSLPAGAL